MMHSILKVDDDLQLVLGVALVAGEEDSQGDVITEHELTKTAMTALGASVKIDHRGEPVGKIVQSLALTPDLAKSLGISWPGKPAWIVGLKVDDASTWQRIKAGELNGGLSIGGRATRESLP